MQESGVSKQVSVRFEDVGADGHIRPERLAEAEGGDKKTQGGVVADLDLSYRVRLDASVDVIAAT